MGTQHSSACSCLCENLRIYGISLPKKQQEEACRAALDLDGPETRPRMAGAGFCLLLQVSPILPYADFHQQRDGQRVNVFHLIAHQVAHGLHFCLWNFEHQFIVHLQGHA